MNWVGCLIVLSLIIMISCCVPRRQELFDDDTRFHNQNVEVKNSNISGRGVFALKDFEEGELIELAPSLIDDCGNFRGKVGDYMTYSPGDGSKCALNMGYFNYYNHKDDNNANYYVDAEKECISVISTRPIENGEEIFVNYGGAYWEARADRLKKL